MKQKNNIKNFAKALLVKYCMLLIYIIGFVGAMDENMLVFGICCILAFVLLIIMIIYEWKFIVGEMR